MIYHKIQIIVSVHNVSGTSWKAQILRLMLNRDTSKQLQEVVPFMELINPDGSTGLNLLSEMPSPRIMVSHLRPNFFGGSLQKSSARFIVGMRNPKDVAVSYFNYYRASASLGKFTGSFDEFFSMFIKGEVIFGDFFEHVAAWWKYKDDPRFLFLSFEDMKKDPFKANKDISDFLKLDLSEGRLKEVTEQTKFKAMQGDRTLNLETFPAAVYDSNISKYLRTGEVGDWVNTLTDMQSEAIDEKYKAILEPMGIKFEFQS